MAHLRTGRLDGLCWLLLPILIAFAAPARADEAAFYGVWDVNTRLTAASAAVNPDYRPGDLRIDVWQIRSGPGSPTLTTRDGTIAGRIAGDQAQFYAEVPVGNIILMRLLVSAFLDSSRSMAGTITAEYWDTRFGYKAGLDAWSFGVLRR